MMKIELNYDQKNTIINLCRFLDPCGDQENPEDNGWSGRNLRKSINNGKRWFWQRMSGPAFYQMMAGLEDQGLVERHVVEKFIDGVKVKESRFVATKLGCDTVADG